MKTTFVLMLVSLHGSAVTVVPGYRTQPACDKAGVEAVSVWVRTENGVPTTTHTFDYICFPGPRR